MIALEKHSGVCLIRVVETERLICTKCVSRFTRPESTSACQDDHICGRLKAGFDGSIKGVRAI